MEKEALNLVAFVAQNIAQALENAPKRRKVRFGHDLFQVYKRLVEIHNAAIENVAELERVYRELNSAKTSGVQGTRVKSPIATMLEKQSERLFSVMDGLNHLAEVGLLIDPEVCREVNEFFTKKNSRVSGLIRDLSSGVIRLDSGRTQSVQKEFTTEALPFLDIYFLNDEPRKRLSSATVTLDQLYSALVKEFGKDELLAEVIRKHARR